MLTDPKLKSQVDQLWNKLWSGGLTNPLDAIEQLSYLIFFKRLDDQEQQAEKHARLAGVAHSPRLPEAMRWSVWTHYTADAMLRHVRETIFPWLRTLGSAGSSFERYMQNAEFKINKPSLLVEACKLIDQMQIANQNQDVQGDLYEYLLSKLNTAGRNGQFRTPRHIIRMMVQMIDPKPYERMGDLAAGTCGFPVNMYQYILEQHTSPEVLTYDEEGLPHNLIGDRLTPEQRTFLQTKAFRAYDNDSGMAMLRIGSMNLMLHGIEHPAFFYMDTLAKAFVESGVYDVLLMNPPFKGAVDKDDVNPTLPGGVTKSELLFVHLILRALDMGGRAGVIVPDGVLFGSSNAHVALRKKLVEEHRLDGVVSMPGGVFKPYAGVSTAVLFFTKGAATERIWFYDMAHDGFSLDDKRQPTTQNDIPDILACWRSRHDAAFADARAARLANLQEAVTPYKAQRLALEATLHRLRFESVIDGDGEAQIHRDLQAAQAELAQVQAQIAPLHGEIEQLSRQFWVSKEQVRANGYDLTASRYRQVVQDEAFYEAPGVTLERLLHLEATIASEVSELKGLMA